MYFPLLIITVLLNIFKVIGLDICDSDCACKFKRSGGEIKGEDIDCTYNPNILKSEYIMPNNAHALDLTSNNLTRVHASSLLRSQTLAYLYLNDNFITTIEANAFELPNLEHLDLSNNRLELISKETFGNIRKLQYLNLASNKFTTFTKLTFHPLSALKEIYLDNNDIGQSLREVNLFDRNGFGLTPNIKTLSISGTNLNVVSNNFFIDAYDLKKLVVSNNNLNDTFQIPYTLEYFDISDNPIKEISIEDFNDLPGLKVLKLNNLQITEVPGYVFSPLRGLLELQLERNNNLTQFSVFAFGQEVLDDWDNFVLEKLSLKRSRVTTLDEQLLEPFGQLLRLDLQGNPWRCDCNLVWIKKLRIEPIYNEHLRCGSPKPIYNRKIFDLDESYFVCAPARHYIGMAIAAVTLCLILAIVAVWLFVFIPRYHTRCHFLQNLYASATPYTMLPVISEDRF